MTAFARAFEKPAHVPDDHVIELDIYNIDMQDGNYQEAINRLKTGAKSKIVWTPFNGGHWIATTADVIDTVTSDTRTFSSKKPTLPKERNPDPPLVPIGIDPPEAGKYRALLLPYLSPQAVARLAEQARALSIQLIDEIAPRGRCDFVNEFAHHMPIFLFMQIAGFPDSDRQLLTGIAANFVRPDSLEVRQKAYADFARYAQARINERRGGTGTDMVTGLANAVVDGKPVSDGTLLGMIVLTMSAGLDTVASTLGFITHFLALNVEHRRQLIEQPALIPNAVEELLRRFPIVNVARLVAEDTELHGVKLREGDMIALPTALYGLDDERYPEPLKVDFHRKRPHHFSFGNGEHRCIGSMLARAELRIFLEEWLKRIPDFRLKPGQRTDVKIGTAVTMTNLELEWDVT